VLVGKLEVLQALKASHRKSKDGGGADGLSVLLGTLSPGDVFGEMSLLDGSSASATVRTRTRSWVLLLPGSDYEDTVARHPQIKEHLAKVAAERRERNQAAREISAGYREERLEPV
jgi:CRP-like cAMP-binding protein